MSLTKHSYDGVIPVVRGEEERYFEFCREGRLMIQRCTSCDVFIFYPRAVCPECLEGELDWVEVDGRGEIFTFTVQHRNAPGFEGQAPYVVAMVELREGIRMMSRVMCHPDEARIGLHVTVEFADVGDGFVVPVFVPEAVDHG